MTERGEDEGVWKRRRGRRGRRGTTTTFCTVAHTREIGNRANPRCLWPARIATRNEGSFGRVTWPGTENATSESACHLFSAAGARSIFAAGSRGARFERTFDRDRRPRAFSTRRNELTRARRGCRRAHEGRREGRNQCGKARGRQSVGSKTRELHRHRFAATALSYEGRVSSFLSLFSLECSLTSRI